MKVVLGAVLLFTIPCSVATFSQDAGTAATAACSPKDEKLKVNPATGRDSSSQLESDKALVNVIADDGTTDSIVGAGITLRVGLDGAWVGAVNHHYLSVSRVLGLTGLAPFVRQLAIKLRVAIEADSSRAHRRTGR